MAELVFLEPTGGRRGLKEQPHRPHDGRPSIAFVTLGCKVNQSDTQKAIADFRAAGFRIVPPSDHADVYVVNTCSVTHVADRKSRQWLRRGARANPDALVVAMGCYAESGREALEEMPEVGLVVGYKSRDNLTSLVLDRVPAPVANGGVAVADEEPERVPSWAGGEGDTGLDYRGRTRAMVKIEDGCNDFCTFCIIPFTRGMPRSTPTGEIVRTVNARLSEGFKEIVLTGVHMGKYGQDHAQRKRAAADSSEAPNVAEAIRAVLERTAVPRLRITSLEPTDAPTVLGLMTDEQHAGRLAPHLHLPLQSGCDATLERMKRDYTTAEFARVVRQCREAVPGIAITTDLISGFPGETEDEWAQTMAFVGEMEFSKVHVFPYSKRPGTPAEMMDGQVPPDVAQERTHRAIELSERLEAAYAVRHLGTTRPVLWEEHDEASGVWGGLTDNYLRTRTRSDIDLHNRITPARITSYDAQGLWAQAYTDTPNSG